MTRVYWGFRYINKNNVSSFHFLGVGGGWRGVGFLFFPPLTGQNGG